MNTWRGVAAATLALVGGTAAAQAVTSWDVSAGVLQRRLVERGDDGRRLVEETGPMLRLALGARHELAAGGALRAELGVAAGELDYDGRTQAGAPHRTDSRHRDIDATLAWRPWAAASWGEAWLVLRAVQQRREIASTATVGGIDETSTLVLPGLRWTHAFEAGAWRWRPSLELRTSAWHRLDVDYHGVFDAQELDGGHRNEVVLGLEAAAADSPWSWSLEWTHSRQQATSTDTLRRGGVAVGTVRQPRIEIDDVMLKVRRVF